MKFGKNWQILLSLPGGAVRPARQNYWEVPDGLGGHINYSRLTFCRERAAHDFPVDYSRLPRARAAYKYTGKYRAPRAAKLLGGARRPRRAHKLQSAEVLS